MNEPIIFNGDRDTPAIDWSLDYSGQRWVPLYSTGGADVIDYINSIVGPRPSMPELGPGGEMVLTGAMQIIDDGLGNQMGAPQYAYSPAGDVVNQTKALLYATQADAWLKHYQLVMDMVQAFLLQHAAKVKRANDES